MKRFQFPLDRVLRYRQMQAETEEARLQAQLGRLAEVDGQIAGLEREGLRTEDAVRQTLAADCEVLPGQLASYPGYRLVLARGKKGLLEERRRRVEEVEKQRAAVLHAHQAREVLQRARAEAHRRWEEDYNKETDATAGELFLSQWKRRSR